MHDAYMSARVTSLPQGDFVKLFIIRELPLHMRPLILQQAVLWTVSYVCVRKGSHCALVCQ